MRARWYVWKTEKMKSRKSQSREISPKSRGRKKEMRARRYFGKAEKRESGKAE